MLDREVFSAQLTDKGFLEWKANASGEYYFKAKLVISVGWINSQNTPVYGIINVSRQISNENPVAIIDEPLNGAVYFTANIVSFNQSSYDIDDYIDYLWNAGDGTTKSGDTKDYIDHNFTHSYVSSGNIDIALSVSDNRGGVDYNSRTILVLDPVVSGKYVLANILKPVRDGVHNKLKVSFDATGSYAVEYDAASGALKCLGGDCPMTTADGSKNIADNGKRGDFSYLNFTWEFDEPDSSLVNIGGINGQTFDRTFVTYDEHWAKVTVFLFDDAGITDEADTRFRTKLFDGCTRDGRFWLENGVPTDTVNIGKCQGIDGFVGGIDCCPDEYNCTDSTDDGIPNPKCEFNTLMEEFCRTKNIKRCNDYDNEPDCLNDLALCRVGITGEDTDVCGGDPVTGGHIDCGIPGSGSISTFIVTTDNCTCEWDPVMGCYLEYDITPTVNSQSIIHTCTFSITAGPCIGNFMDVTKNGDITWDPFNIAEVKLNQGFATDLEAENWLNFNCGLDSLCPSGTDSFLCGDDLLQLPFFTIKNFIIAVVLIIIIYFVINLRKKRK